MSQSSSSNENETRQLAAQTATWDPVKFDLAFKGRRLISFDELYKYYRYDGVKSRITNLSYDPWDGLKIAFVLTGLMAIIAVCMVACHYREKARQKRLLRQEAVWIVADAAAADAEAAKADAEEEAEAAKSACPNTDPDGQEEEAMPLRQDLHQLQHQHQHQHQHQYQHQHQRQHQHQHQHHHQQQRRKSHSPISRQPAVTTEEQLQLQLHQEQQQRRESIKVHFHRSQCGSSSG